MTRGSCHRSWPSSATFFEAGPQHRRCVAAIAIGSCRVGETAISSQAWGAARKSRAMKTRLGRTLAESSTGRPNRQTTCLKEHSLYPSTSLRARQCPISLYWTYNLQMGHSTHLSLYAIAPRSIFCSNFCRGSEDKGQIAQLVSACKLLYPVAAIPFPSPLVRLARQLQIKH